MHSKIKAVITAGGNAQLKPLTYVQNKHLIPLANKPMIFYVIEHLAFAGFKEVGIICSSADKELRLVIGDGVRWGINIEYIIQEKPLGLGQAVVAAQPYVGQSPFVFYLGDNMVKHDLVSLIDYFLRNNLDCLLTLFKSRDCQQFGVPEMADGKIVRLEERPFTPKSDFAVAGLYFYNHHIFEAAGGLKLSSRGYYEIQDLHNYLIKNGFKVDWQEIDGWWKDRSHPEAILEGNRFALDNYIKFANAGFIEPSVIVQGEVEIGRGTKILGRSILRGPISIGSDVLIKDSYIGPYTSVGSQTEIHNAEIEYSMIMEGVHIHTSEKIINSLIGRHSSITRAKGFIPAGKRIIIGENATLSI